MIDGKRKNTTLSPCFDYAQHDVHHITTSPHHHITTSPHHHITTSPHHHIATSPHHHIAISPHHNMEPKQIRTGKSVPCRSCKAAIFFLPTKNGKMMPIDAETVAVDDDVYMPSIHRSHFDTCPDAKKFSKK